MLDSEYIWTVAVAVFIGWCIHASMHSDSFEIHHSYVIVCSGTRDGDSCKGRWRHEHVITYAISRERQTVVADYSDGDAGKFTDCAVADDTHWDCTVTALGTGYYFSYDGSDYYDGRDPPTELRVGWLRYQYQRFQDLLSP